MRNRLTIYEQTVTLIVNPNKKNGGNKMLESLNVLCVNSSESLNNTADKLLTFQKLGAANQGFLFPKTVLMTPKTKPSFIAFF